MKKNTPETMASGRSSPCAAVTDEKDDPERKPDVCERKGTKALILGPHSNGGKGNHGGEKSMSYTLEQFAASCHDVLKADPGLGGRRKVCLLLAQALQDESFVSTYLSKNVSERTLLYEDPELGFCILAHTYQGPKDSAPHDHGPSWAVYGQGDGETQMTDWQRVESAPDSTIGKVRQVRTYTLTPGMAHLYNEGDVHSPRRSGPTRLIRIEGCNMEKVRRFTYQPA
jgi:hypothetical protein